MKKIIILVPLMLFLLVGAGVCSQEPSSIPTVKTQTQAPPKTINKTSNDATKDASNSLTPIDIEPGTQSNHRETNRDAGNKNDKDTTNWWIMWATIAMAGFALCQVVAMVFQYCTMRQQTEQLRRSVDVASKATAATLVAADAAKSSAESLPRVERAYVFVEVKADSKKNDDFDAAAVAMSYRPMPIVVHFFNHGRTPAIVDEIRMYAPCVTTKSSNFFETVKPPARTPPGIVIASGESIHSDLPLMIPVNEWREVMSGKTRQLCLGRITYKDVFGDIHQTGFCWQWVESQNSFLITDDKKLNYHT